jgi:methyltransferase-like protein
MTTSLKRLEHEADHSPPYSAAVKFVWSSTSTLPICINGVDNDNVTYIFTDIAREEILHDPFFLANFKKYGMHRLARSSNQQQITKVVHSKVEYHVLSNHDLHVNQERDRRLTNNLIGCS